MADYKTAIEEIKSAANIVDVIGSVITLKRSGSNHKGCCPFHKEKTPSFIVSESKGHYHCFGCGEDGDVLTFVQKYYNISFSDAVDKLAAQYGITVEKNYSPEDQKKDVYYEANKLAARYFFDRISKEANKGYGYMSKRGMDAKTMQSFGIGWATEEWSDLCDFMKTQGIDTKMLVELGLASEKNGRVYDKFRSRVIFPIFNVRNKIIGFGGRIVGEGDPKYLNSPENIIFKKKDNLYGLNKTKSFIQEQGYAILVEGYMDCVSLYQYGICNVAASLGTALTENQARLLSRYTKKVVLCYDADQAGINAALRGIDVLRGAGLEVKVLHVDDGKDPDEYIKKNGRDAFLELVEKKSVPDVDYKINLLRKRYKLEDSFQGVKFMKEVAVVLKGLGPVEADIYTQKYARQFHISEAALKREVEGIKLSAQSPQRQTQEKEETVINISSADKNLERMIIKLIMLHSDYFSMFSKYPEAFVTSEGYNLKLLFENKYKNGTDFALDELKDSLSDKEYDYLLEIINTVETGNDELAVKDCIEKLDFKRDSIRLKEINEILEMSDALPDEDVNQNQMKELMEEYQAIQIKRRGIK